MFLSMFFFAYFKTRNNVYPIHPYCLIRWLLIRAGPFYLGVWYRRGLWFVIIVNGIPLKHFVGWNSGHDCKTFPFNWGVILCRGWFYLTSIIHWFPFTGSYVSLHYCSNSIIRTSIHGYLPLTFYSLMLISVVL